MSTLTATSPTGAARVRPAAARPSRLARFVRPSLADALFLLLLLRILQLGATNLFNDPGTGWHLRTGHDILVTGLVPLVDTYSYTRQGQPWVQTQWLADALMSVAYSLGGYDLLALGTALLIAGLFRWIYRTQIDAGGWPTLALLVTICAACAASGHFLARPLVATSIGVPLTFWWASQYARGALDVRKLVLLVPLAALWANLHPGVLGGIATVGMCGTGLLIQAAWPTFKKIDRTYCRRALTLIAIALAMGAATFINPYGIGWHAWIAKIMGMDALKTYVVEWKPPAWNDLATWATIALVVLVASTAALRRKGLNLAEAAVLLFWIWQGFGSGRHLPLLAMVLALQLARLLANARTSNTVLHRLGGLLPLFSKDIKDTERRFAGGLTSLAAAGVLIGLVQSGTIMPQLGIGVAGPSEKRYSRGAMAWLNAHPPSGALFNDLNYGGTLIHQVPGLKVYADDRFGLYGEAFIADYRNAVLDPDNYAAQMLESLEAQTVLMAPHLPMCDWLMRQPNWAEVYQDKAAAIFNRCEIDQETTGE